MPLLKRPKQGRRGIFSGELALRSTKSMFSGLGWVQQHMEPFKGLSQLLAYGDSLEIMLRR